MTTGALPDIPPDTPDLQELLASTQTALRASQAREAALRGELEHRVRNALAVSRSVFTRTMDSAASVEDARDHFLGRLDALARYHSRLAVPKYAFDLETMVWDELMVFGSANDPRILVGGPDVRVDAPIAQAVGLALHELATNSVKFGVLGEPENDGRLKIAWEEHDRTVQLEWAESGVPIVAAAPIPSGFGRDFIEHGLPYQIGANTDFSLVPGGLVCRIRFAPKASGGVDPSPSQVVHRS